MRRTELSLFSGIGLGDLGAEVAGVEIVGQVEIEPWCRRVLESHWPGLWRRGDIRKVTDDEFRMFKGCWCIAGGFPCQDISVAGRGAGITGSRSRLWVHLRRAIRLCRPAWARIENVPALRTRGVDRVLSDMEKLGYTCTTVVVGAAAVGAPHRRDRVWIICRRRPDSPWERRVSNAHHSASTPELVSVRPQPEASIVAGSGRMANSAWERGEQRADRDGTGAGGDAGGAEGGSVPVSEVLPQAGADAMGGTVPPVRRFKLGQPDDSPDHRPHGGQVLGLQPQRVGGCVYCQGFRCDRQCVADTRGERCDKGTREQGDQGGTGFGWSESGGGCGMGDPQSAGLEGHGPDAGCPQEPQLGNAGLADTDIGAGRIDQQGRGPQGSTPLGRSGAFWPAGPGQPQHPWECPRLTEPGLGGSTDDRRLRRKLVGWRKAALKGLGNAQVPLVVAAVVRAMIRIEESEQ